MHIDYGSGGAGSDTHRGVFHVRGFFTEDGTQQLLFWSELRFALWRDLADKDVTWLHFRTDVDNAHLIELAKRTFTHVRNIRRDFFSTELGIPRNAREFLDVNGCKPLFFHHLFRDQNRVFEVVSVPRHERDAHVLT